MREPEPHENQPIDWDRLTLRLRALRADIATCYCDQTQDFPWIIGFSGGKDSTVLLQLIVEEVLALPRSKRTRPIHVLSNDTLVEAPPMEQHLTRTLEAIRASLPTLDAPITVAKVSPDRDQTFWVNLIGRGYPSPNRQFRWCTDRMKIAPTNRYIGQQVANYKKVILVLGVRKDESSLRARSIAKHTTSEKYNAHSTLQGCLVYRPIVDLTTPEVWSLLLQSPPPWGGTHKALVTLYRNAGGGECPLVIDKETAPSCGTTSPRFGCWTCTVVQKDKSLRGFVDAGMDELEPLSDYRDWLFQLRSDPKARSMTRRNGNSGPGPFTLETRRIMLQRLLDLQRGVGHQLISESEVHCIREIWLQDELTGLTRQLRFITGT